MNNDNKNCKKTWRKRDGYTHIHLLNHASQVFNYIFNSFCIISSFPTTNTERVKKVNPKKEQGDKWRKFSCCFHHPDSSSFPNSILLYLFQFLSFCLLLCQENNHNTYWNIWRHFLASVKNKESYFRKWKSHKQRNKNLGQSAWI